MKRNQMQVRSQRRAFQQLKNSLHGHANRLRALDPPATNRRPYFSVVVQQTVLSTGTSIGIEVSSVVKALANQLGLVANDNKIINVKIQRCDVWGVSKANSSVRPAVNADFSSFVPTVGDFQTPGNAVVAYPLMKRLEDIGGVTSAAKVSYSWPRSMSDIPLNQTANFVVVEVASNLTEIDIRWHVQFSTADIADAID
jgi:hypothetical protein